MRIRSQVDTVGFPASPAALRTVLQRIDELQGDELANALNRTPPGSVWRAAVIPHDDFAYVGHLYPAAVRGLVAPTVILFGVAHAARAFGLEGKLILDSFSRWAGALGPADVSELRELVSARMPPDTCIIDDEMHAREHSLEPIVPLLQMSIPNVRILPVLVPAMSFDRIEEIAARLADLLAGEFRERRWRLGTDVAIGISSDAVHYGDEGWTGRSFARYGTDPEGTRRAIDHEIALIEECFVGPIDTDSLRRFWRYTVRSDDFHEYNWTWCGRYSVPMGLLFASRLSEAMGDEPLTGHLVGYGTSVDGRERIPVEDLGMGITAPAHARHWVGYATIGFT